MDEIKTKSELLDNSQLFFISRFILDLRTKRINSRVNIYIEASDFHAAMITSSRRISIINARDFKTK